MATLEHEITVMVVDDTPENLDLLEAILHGAGYRVVAFPRAAMALRAAADQPPDIFLLDVMMPGMDGFEMCLKLKDEERLRDIPVIFISARDDIENKVRAFSRGGVDYVSKPFQAEELLARISTHVCLRQQRLKLEAQQRQIQQNFERLRELEFHRDQLVHMYMHDLRSPLQAIMGFAEILQDELAEEGRSAQADLVTPILKSSHAMQNSISTLLDISRLEDCAMPMKKQSCDLHQLVADAQAELGSLARDVAGGIELTGAPGEVYCDSGLTRRIIQNLLANAITYAGKFGTIHIELTQDENGEGRVAVRDEGPGIPPEDVPRIFDKFSQVEARREGKAHASGLGLTFCKLAVEAQGGRIGASSTEEEGSEFWFTLPSAPRMEQDSDPTDRTPTEG